MTMIAVGQGLRGLANKGFEAVARAESVENQQRMGMEAQKKAAESQTLGTGAGIGGMVGATRLAAAAKAAKAAGTVGGAPVGPSATAFVPDAALSSSLISPTAPVSATAFVPDAALSSSGLISPTAPVSATALAPTAAPVVGGTAAPVVGGTAAPVVGTTTTGVTAATTGTAAGGSAGTMASLMTLAGPIAIGLGAAFLINKLFD